MKYSSSCRKPYRPLVASRTATKTAAITQASAGTRSERGGGAGVSGGGAAVASGLGTTGLSGWFMGPASGPPADVSSVHGLDCPASRHEPAERNLIPDSARGLS